MKNKTVIQIENKLCTESELRTFPAARTVTLVSLAKTPVIINKADYTAL